MPRVRINTRQYMTNDLYDWILGEMRRHHMTQASLGKEMGYKQTTLSYRLNNQALDVKDLITIFSIFNTEEETIVRLLKEKK